MGSKTKKVKCIRDRKKRPNKSNQKADMKRVQRNREILKELESRAGA